VLRRAALLTAFSTLALVGAASSLPVAAPPATTTTTIAKAATVPVPPAAVTTSTAASTVVLSGHGWGHGMGMGQWGAYGFALHGWRYDAILAHYYRGTTLGSEPPRTVRVLLAEGKARVALESAADWRVVDAEGTAAPLPPGKLVLDPSLRVSGKALVPPLTFTAGRSSLELGTGAYRGKLVVSLVGKRLQVVNRVGLEPYLMGVVPSEVPSSWPREALKAQAVAARSYALANLTTLVTASNYDVFDDTRSQVYGGIPVEHPATSAAVKDTAHQVVLYDGKIATTYFSSSSGGRTVSAAELTGKPVPYLVSVNDPYDTYATHHNWGPVVFDAATVAKAVGLGGPLLELRTTRGPSKHVTKVTAVGPTSQVVLTGAALRFGLGLRSSWFTVGWLALTPVVAPLNFGTGVTLTGIGRGVSGVTLHEKPAGGDWQPVAEVVPDAAGAFAVEVTPDVTTSYRLTSGDLHGALVTVAVAPPWVSGIRVGGVAGTIRPALEGSPVQLQLQNGAVWTTVATAKADAAGAFAVPFPGQIVPGSYRIRSAPGHGLAPGVSLPLTIS
jgi:stage II sporulation protein D